MRHFPDRFPIGVQLYGPPHVLLYLVTRPSPIDFRAFLLRHAILLAALRQWTVRLLFPRPLARATVAYQHAAREHLATGLNRSSADELAWFFRERHRLVEEPTGAPDRRFRDDAMAFAAPRFGALYRGWITQGDPVLWPCSSGSNSTAPASERATMP